MEKKDNTPQTAFIMDKETNTPKSREEIFRAKAETYQPCYSTTCPLREHCLHSILAAYVPNDKIYIPSVNLNNPKTQRPDCPVFRRDEPVRMPVGLAPLYYDMPGRMERAVKGHLIDVYSRTRYYQYHNGSRPIPPDVEAYIRQTLQNFGWPDEPHFAGYVEEFLW